MKTYVDLVRQAETQPVFVSDVRRSLASQEPRIHAILVLPDGNATKTFSVPVGSERLEPSTPEFELLVSCVRATVYNHLATLGGLRLALYLPEGRPDVTELARRVVADFELDRSRAERTRYARIVNMLDRMNDALHPDMAVGERRFRIDILPVSGYPANTESASFRAAATDLFVRVTEGLANTIVAGLDVGGTDIKGALAVGGRLVALKEFDWNPARAQNVEEIIDPILVIARLLRAYAAVSVESGATRQSEEELARALDAALRPAAGIEEMDAAATAVERAYPDLRPFDGIGLCFPDVVVRNRVVGGEVPKTQGMRGNASREFESQFAELSRLNARLEELCVPGGTVMNTNDGPMAAFTAAVELAASPQAADAANGVFAHTLGTDLGTGLVLADGSIPEIPLEAYNLILDLGSNSARAFAAADVRSLANTNSGIAGTPQKLASQAAAFRLADELFSGSRNDLVEAIRAKGFIVDEEQRGGQAGVRTVPEAPSDLRKPYLAYLMSLAERDDAAAEIFRRIGEYMAVIYDECETILDTGLRERFLFGRFVKSERCFELMQEGAARRGSDVRFIAADSGMAYTPLMKALANHPDYTVAQFGQAVGAIYFANVARTSR